MNIETRIKEIRESKRIKLAEVAAVLEVDVSNYSKLEKRGSKLSIEQLEKIAKALDVTLIEILSGKPQNSEPSQNEKALQKQNEELKKRVEGLEDALKDKELINRNLTEKLTICEEYLNEILEGLFTDIAIEENHFGTLVYLDNNNIVKITNKELEELSSEKLDEIYSHDTTYEFSDHEIEETMKELFTNEKHRKLSSLIMWTGMIKDEMFVKYFKKYIVHTNPTVQQMMRMVKFENNPLGVKGFDSRTGFELD
ncbi:hypothetical protein DR864_09125 [Runella rosea]|uniref:HTH cro/C1-type domain-containing protein n=1 Tax=Runella rosea TaxID=2259595 RepID=A0A344TGW0_9BACT|nr:helix-turn-helix transcriptional regulator [Runella rosea]AXE17881.1 hypothetical protein DR864_09125 [Runella rosea]